MMRLAWFLILSVSLHATALVYPVSFGGHAQPEAIRVAILPIENGAGGAASPSGFENPKLPRDMRSRRATPSPVEPRIQMKSPVNRESEKQPTPNVAAASDGNIEWVAAMANSADTVAPARYRFEDDDWMRTDPSASSTGSGNGFYASGRGNGLASGNGIGSSVSAIDRVLTQARYRDTPRPEYPDAARRAGREGRVLLRVLIDDQGEAKAVEVSASSGSEVLDQAATSAIKRWRFHPARAGDQPIESWVSVPIDFRLTEAKN